MSNKLILILVILFMANFASAQWQQADCHYPEVDRIECMAANGANIFAGRYMGIYRSTDNGQTWSSIDVNAGYSYVNDFAFSGTNVFMAINTGGVRLSTDNGDTWKAVNNGLPVNANVRTVATGGNNIMAGVWDDGIYLSTDNGVSWTKKSNGLTNQNIYTIAISGNNVFAGTMGGLFMSTDLGNNWTHVNLNNVIRDVFSITIMGNNIFAGTDNSGIYLSNNNGSSWTTVNNGLTGNRIFSLASAGTRLFAGIANEGVFLSADNGSNWTAVNANLPVELNNGRPLYPYIGHLAANGTDLFCGTYGQEIWYRPLSQMTSIEDVKNQLTIGIYPNPADDMLILTGIAKTTTLKLYDALGKLVIETETATNSALDISRLNAGLYTLVADNGEARSANKVLVAR